MHTVYVETNFILRLALSQEQSNECERIVGAAEANKLMLALPILALFESLYKLRGKRQNRAEQSSYLLRMLDDLRRSDVELHQEVASYLQQAHLRIGELDDHEREELAATIDRLRQCAHILPVSPSLFHEAYEHERRALQSADALMLTAILTHARDTQGERFFLTSDSDFSSSPAVRQLIKDAGLQLFHKPQVLLTRLRARGVLPG